MGGASTVSGFYRIVAMLGWTELIANHITYRLPDTPDAQEEILINPFGLLYEEVTASNLLKVDIEGNKLMESQYSVNQGYHFHAAVHKNVPAARCVLHTHSVAGVAVASLEEPIQFTNFSSLQLAAKLGYHDFEGPRLDPGEMTWLAKNLGDEHSLILKNHWLLTIGRTIPEAFYRMWTLQRACEIYLAAAAAGKLRPIPENECKEFLELAKVIRAPDGRSMQENAGYDVFAALVRKIDKIDTDWRQ